MRVPAVAWLALAAAGCGGAPPDVAELRLEPAPGNGIVGTARHATPAFDVLACDDDGDGDVDALVNWHHHAPFERLENRAGRFHASPAVAEEPALYADAAEMERRIREAESEGLHLWHDPDRGGRWRFLWRDPEGRLGGLAARVGTSLGFLLHEGLADDEWSETAPDRARLRLPAEAGERAFSVQTRRIAVRLGVGLEAAPDRTVPPLLVGTGLTPTDGEVTLWKDDPHGAAWLDLRGRGRPDLFVARGALGGELHPPQPGKRDRLLEATGPGAPLYRPVAGAVPPDHRRARRVEAIAPGGGAGPLAVWVGARDTPNRLLVWNDGAQRFEDRAAERGLDRSGASTAAFFDTDGDGLDDLVYVAERAVERLPGRPDGGFGGPERLAPLPAVGPPAGVIDPARLRPVDLDRDGDLDLLLLAWGTPPRTRVFRRIGAGFADVTADLGVEGLAAGRAAVVADLDLDGFPDVVQLGARAALWHNRAGERFEVRPLPPSVVPPGTTAATVLDADGDRAPDVLAVGHRVRLLWNRSEHTHHAVRVELPAHRVGALVTAEYRDGTRQAQRFGSEHSTAFSQALQPLLFGASDANPVEAIVVRVPGGGAERTALAGRREISLPTP